MNDTFLFAIILSFVVGYTASKTLKHKCGYNLIEGTVNSGPCSASEELVPRIITVMLGEMNVKDIRINPIV
jgi:hypothetical protein